MRARPHNFKPLGTGIYRKLSEHTAADACPQMSGFLPTFTDIYRHFAAPFFSNEYSCPKAASGAPELQIKGKFADL
jgi:hypothetical protein